MDIRWESMVEVESGLRGVGWCGVKYPRPRINQAFGCPENVTVYIAREDVAT